MTDLARRFPANPLISPADVPPSRPDLSVLCVLNPGAFHFEGKTWLVLRVAEGIPAGGGTVSALVLDATAPEGMRRIEPRVGDPDLILGDDPRGFIWRGDDYLTTISHLRLASSQDGVSFRIEPLPALEGEGHLESYGIEDCRVTEIDGRYHLAYTAVSPDGFGVGVADTGDWRSYHRHGMVLPPPNKDCVLFPEMVGGAYVALHRPVTEGLGLPSMWIARSHDLVHWGEQQCVLRPRRGMWDSTRLGAGPPPLRIPEGWLEIYHGVDQDQRYCLGAVLLDAGEPAQVLGRSPAAIMEPLANYELQGFFGNVVFATGAFAEDDRLTIYYGAADKHVCGAAMSIQEILAALD